MSASTFSDCATPDCDYVSIVCVDFLSRRRKYVAENAVRLHATEKNMQTVRGKCESHSKTCIRMSPVISNAPDLSRETRSRDLSFCQNRANNRNVIKLLIKEVRKSRPSHAESRCLVQTANSRFSNINLEILRKTYTFFEGFWGLCWKRGELAM